MGVELIALSEQTIPDLTAQMEEQSTQTWRLGSPWN